MNPIFIGGCPRSGTTMLGALLGSHSACIATPESQFKNELISNPSLASDPSAWIDYLSTHWRFKIWDVDLQDLKDQNIKSFRGLLNQAVSRYAAKESKPAASCWIDHTPSNFRYVSRLKSLYPDAKFIHIVRDGRAIAASVMPLDWGPNEIINAGKWWMEHVVFGLAAEKFTSDVMMVRYESILENPEEELKKICAFAGIVYEPIMISGKGFTVPEYTKQQHELVGGGIVKDRKEAWKTKLTPRQIELFEDTTKGLLEYFGYELHFKSGAREANALEKLQSIISLWKTFVNKKFRYPARRKKIHASSPESLKI